MNSKIYDYSCLKADIVNLERDYRFLHVSEIGTSACRRPLYLLQLGSSDTKQAVLYAGAFHGMEWITAALLVNFTRRLCESCKTRIPVCGFSVNELLKTRTVCIVPMVNPDGVEISLHGAQSAGNYSVTVRRASPDPTHWQANARGVDLNHNFNADWYTLHRMEMEQGILGPSPTRYGGEFPESEPESSALAEFCRQRYFSHTIAFHSQGEEIYWQYGKHTPESAYSMAEMLSMSSGYKIANPEKIASMGGFKDWFIDYFHRPGFTIEVGKGRNPLPFCQLASIQKQLTCMMMRGLLL